MRTLVIVVMAVALLAGVAYAKKGGGGGVDYGCYIGCLIQGGSDVECRLQCTSPRAQLIAATDYVCLNRCLASGYSYGFCQRVCGY